MRASPRNVASEKFARVNATTLTPILAKAWLVICSGPQAVNVVSALKRVCIYLWASASTTLVSRVVCTDATGGVGDAPRISSPHSSWPPRSIRGRLCLDCRRPTSEALRTSRASEDRRTDRRTEHEGWVFAAQRCRRQHRPHAAKGRTQQRQSLSRQRVHALLVHAQKHCRVVLRTARQSAVGGVALRSACQSAVLSLAACCGNVPTVPAAIELPPVLEK